MKKMNEYFNAEAELHDDLFIKKMGLDEFYDAVELALNDCTQSSSVLVLGCGSGLEIERIKFPCDVLGVDISEKMLEVLNAKELDSAVKLTTVCASLLDIHLGKDKYDIVLSCYVMHHFNDEQKKEIYSKIYSSLKNGGTFINGDSLARDRAAEDEFMKSALEIYANENMPFASLHVDVPFCWEHEKEVLSAAGFDGATLLKEWTNTKLYKCVK